MVIAFALIAYVAIGFAVFLATWDGNGDFECNLKFDSPLNQLLYLAGVIALWPLFAFYVMVELWEMRKR
jgi:hypothetical protein